MRIITIISALLLVSSEALAQWVNAPIIKRDFSIKIGPVFETTAGEKIEAFKGGSWILTTDFVETQKQKQGPVVLAYFALQTVPEVDAWLINIAVEYHCEKQLVRESAFWKPYDVTWSTYDSHKMPGPWQPLAPGSRYEQFQKIFCAP